MTTGLLTTTAGQAAIAADLAGGADLVLSHVAFGDSNGVPYAPNEAQVSLVNEKYRSTIASVAVVAGAIVVDAVIPADTPDGSGRPSHGFSIAEAGLYSAAGTLIGVARMGNGYKPPPSSGQAAIATFRFKLPVANPSAISVVIDPQAQVQLGRNVRPFWMTVDGVQNAPPGAPAVGATYVIGAAPTGAWAGFANRLAQWVGVWALASVPEGHLVCDNSKAEDHSQRFMRRTAAGWVSALMSPTAVGLIDAATDRAQALNYLTPAGTANALTLTPAPAFASLAALVGVPLRVAIASTNTAAATLNVNALGAKSITHRDTTPLIAGDLLAGAIAEMIYDGTAFRLTSLARGDVSRVGRTQVFTASGTFVVPDGITAVFVRVVAGGGGGGGGPAASNVQGAAGGAGGGYSEKFCSVTPGQSIAVTVGPGGGGGAPAANGTSGGSSSFGSFCSASGGGFGTSVGSTFSSGGTGTGGDVNLQGAGGTVGILSGTAGLGGAGGASGWGGAACSQAYANGYSAIGYGAGGGGAGQTGYSGAAGNAGVVVVQW